MRRTQRGDRYVVVWDSSGVERDGSSDSPHRTRTAHFADREDAAAIAGKLGETGFPATVLAVEARRSGISRVESSHGGGVDA